MPDQALTDPDKPARHFHPDTEVFDPIKHLLESSGERLLLRNAGLRRLILSSAV
jgi:hypothetical protein